MRLLLLGCTGFIGRELVPKLLKAGHQITIISRKSPISSKRQFKSDSLVHIQINPAIPENWNKSSLIKALEKANGVINLAGEPIADKRWTKIHCENIKNSRIKTTEGLIQAMRKLKNPPEVLLNGSAIGFYGTSQDNSFIEESKSGDDFLANLCQNWEKIAMQKPNKTRLVILRIGIVLGSDGGALSKMLPIFKAGFGGPIGNGKQWMSWIHRKDLCNLIEKLIKEKKWEGVFNAVSPQPSRMIDFTKTLATVLGRPNLLAVPAPLLKLILGDGAKVVLEGQKVISNKLRRFKFEYPELKEALKEIT